ncbi:MAG: elongation factor P maturation arginine rhamnosyltransferase EarP [Betaproteobacteria bacterium]
MKIDVFCHKVDNYGDIGFAWRLVKSIASLSNPPSPYFIRLICNEQKLLDDLSGGPGQASAIAKILNIEIVTWQECLPSDDDLPSNSNSDIPEAVIACFSCTLPTRYEKHIAKHPNIPVINLEYLSSEPWTASHHKISSLPTQNGISKKSYFFPGFTEQTGKLIQGDLTHMHNSPKIPIALESAWQNLRPGIKRVLIFSYNQVPLASLLDGLYTLKEPLDLLICSGQAQAAVHNWAELSPSKNEAHQYINLPFVSQNDFDWLLAQSDLNVVRGEDSFVRAQWAGKPFIWHIYPQEDLVHIDKLNAFLNIYTANSSHSVTGAVQNAMHGEKISLWWKNLDEMTTHAQEWLNFLKILHKNGDLVTELLEFIQEQQKTS